MPARPAVNFAAGHGPAANAARGCAAGRLPVVHLGQAAGIQTPHADHPARRPPRPPGDQPAAAPRGVVATRAHHVEAPMSPNGSRPGARRMRRSWVRAPPAPPRSVSSF
ncbi:hypothetical protein FRAAL3065 [Frankia alni ACN14a]|uniref:Uncharacterized protein n=1 Tax=Frankia alni (strain DSM 45986 / CECT 9034 / ACN14a) TaxID=326424 RepID=Q0RL96_FRAAA|nr:hypothetical protein FRAAL3065 [Frankia alni ACN14a]